MTELPSSFVLWIIFFTGVALVHFGREQNFFEQFFDFWFTNRF